MVWFCFLKSPSLILISFTLSLFAIGYNQTIWNKEIFGRDTSKEQKEKKTIMTTKELLQLHEDTCKSCREIMEQKNSDYTGGKSSTDPFANFNASSILDIHPVQGLLLRVIDKIQRIRSFTNDKELKVSNESVEDACDDIVNYAILAKAMLMEERSQIEQNKTKK